MAALADLSYSQMLEAILQAALRRLERTVSEAAATGGVPALQPLPRPSA